MSIASRKPVHFLLTPCIEALSTQSVNWTTQLWTLCVTMCEGSWRFGCLSTSIYEHGKQSSSIWEIRLLVILLPICCKNSKMLHNKTWYRVNRNRLGVNIKEHTKKETTFNYYKKHMTQQNFTVKLFTQILDQGTNIKSHQLSNKRMLQNLFLLN